MHHGVCCHSDKFQECVRMASVIWASLLQVCRKIDESPPLMSLSRQYIFLYLFLHYLPLSVDFFTRPPPPLPQYYYWVSCHDLLNLCMINSYLYLTYISSDFLTLEIWSEKRLTWRFVYWSVGEKKKWNLVVGWSYQ